MIYDRFIVCFDYILSSQCSNQWEIIISKITCGGSNKSSLYCKALVYSQSYEQCIVYIFFFSFFFFTQGITVWLYMWHLLPDMDICQNTHHMACLMITEYLLMTALLMFFHIPLANWNLFLLSGEILGIAQTSKLAISTCFLEMQI